jgi:hypothetical protein
MAVMANLWPACPSWDATLILPVRWMAIEKITITEHKGKNIYKKANFKNRLLYLNLTAFEAFLTNKKLLERILGKVVVK